MPSKPKKYDEAEKLINRSIVSLKKLTAEQPDSAVVHDRLGSATWRMITLLGKTKQYERIIEQYPEHTELFEGVYKPKERYTPILLCDHKYIEALYRVSNRHEEVIQTAKEFLDKYDKAKAVFPEEETFPRILCEVYRHWGIAVSRSTKSTKESYPQFQKSYEVALEAVKLSDNPYSRYLVHNRLTFLKILDLLYGYYDKARSSIKEVSELLPEHAQSQMYCAAWACYAVETLNEKEGVSADLIDQFAQDAELYLTKSQELDSDLASVMDSIKDDQITETLKELVTGFSEKN